VLERGLKPEPHQRDMQSRRDRLAADKDALRFAIHEWKEPGTGYLLVIDQMEELLAPIDAEQRAQFDRLLAVALEDVECPLFVISTIRSDFIDRFNLLPSLGRLQNTLCKAYRLYGMSTESLREAIELPARLAGLDVSEVASLMVGEAEDEPGALPLVENALSRLWDPMRRDKLSGQQFKDAGGLAGMLSEGADALLKRIDGAIPGGRTAALELLLRLTRVSPDGRHTRQRISRDEAVQAAGRGDDVKGEQVLLMMSGERPTDRPTNLSSDRLRLVVTSEESGKSYVDLVHETLLRARRHPKDLPGEPELPYWPTLHQYISANLDRDLLRQQLELLVQRYRRKAGQWDRWRHLATWSQLWDFRRLRLVQGSDEARFVALSRRFAAAATVSALAIFVAVGSGLQFAWTERQLTRAIAALASSSPQKRADAAYQIFATDQKRGFVRLQAVYEELLRAGAAPGKTTADVDFQRLGTLEAIASPKLTWGVEDANRRGLLTKAMLEDPSTLIRHKAAAGLLSSWPHSLTQLDHRYRSKIDPQPPTTRIEPISQSVMVLVPKTLAVIGNDGGDPAESPAHERLMAFFWIDREPVTNAQWAAVMKDDPPEYEKSAGALRTEFRASRTSAANADKPVVGITYQQATTYCERSGKRKLPSEFQYELSARGAEGWSFPWGMSPKPAEREAARGVKLKAGLKAAHDSVSLRQFQGELAAADIDLSAFGVRGLVTTVRHWTRTGWTGAHGRSGDGPDCKDWCVVKGASVIEADDSGTRFESSRRLRIDTLNDHVDDNIGFRCVDEKP
jgi:formylglycine-generating enzyme required for sulfatase activity